MRMHSRQKEEDAYRFRGMKADVTFTEWQKAMGLCAMWCTQGSDGNPCCRVGPYTTGGGLGATEHKEVPEGQQRLELAA